VVIYRKRGFNTYADDDTKTVYLIAIGDKDDQHADVEYCKDFVNTLRNQTDIT